MLLQLRRLFWIGMVEPVVTLVGTSGSGAGSRRGLRTVASLAGNAWCFTGLAFRWSRYSGRTSATIRTARSRSSGGYTFPRPTAPSSPQQTEPPETPGRFNRPHRYTGRRGTPGRQAGARSGASVGRDHPRAGRLRSRAHRQPPRVGRTCCTFRAGLRWSNLARCADSMAETPDCCGSSGTMTGGSSATHPGH